MPSLPVALPKLGLAGSRREGFGTGKGTLASFSEGGGPLPDSLLPSVTQSSQHSCELQENSPSWRRAYTCEQDLLTQPGCYPSKWPLQCCNQVATPPPQQCLRG